MKHEDIDHTGLTGIPTGSVATDSIWDAAGDLAVGSGANTAAKLSLAQGSVSRVGGALGYDAGTSFPGSPSTGDRYFRTDDGELYYYDGTRWVSVALYQAPFAMSNAATVAGISASGEAGYLACPLKGTDAIWIETARIVAYVSTTLNGSNHWGLALQTYPTGAAPSLTSLGTAATSADSPSQYLVKTISVGAQVGATVALFVITATKTSSPGNLFVPSAILEYRRIGS